MTTLQARQSPSQQRLATAVLNTLRKYDCYFVSLFFLIVFAVYEPRLLFQPLTLISDLGDGLLNYGFIAQGIGALPDWQSFWNGGMFFPLAETKALSDNLFFPVLVMLPLVKAGVPLILLYNISIALYFVLNGVCFFTLMRELAIPRAIALLASCFFAQQQFFQEHIPHYQLLLTFWYPLIFLFGIRLFKQKSLSQGASLFLCVLGLAASSPYLFIFMGPVIFLEFIVLAALLRHERRLLIKLCALGIPLLVLLVWFYKPYLDVRSLYGLTRSAAEQGLYSAKIRSFGTYAGLWLPEKILGPSPHIAEGNAYIGLVTRLCFCLCLVSIGIREHRRQLRPKRWLLVTIFFVGLFYALAALGPNNSPDIFKISPWHMISSFPGFSGIRSPGRLITMMNFCMAVFLGLGMSAWRRQRFSIIALLLIALHTLEIYPSTSFGTPFINQPSLSDTVTYIKESLVSKPLLYLPLRDSETYQTLGSQVKNALINGNSGFTPASSEHIIFPAVEDCRTEQCLYMLRKLGVAHVIVNKLTAESQTQNFLRQNSAVRSTFSNAGYEIFEVSKNSAPEYFSGDQAFVSSFVAPPAGECVSPVVTASHFSSDLSRLSDHDLASVWSTHEKQKDGFWLQLTWPGECRGHWLLKAENKGSSLTSNSFLRNYSIQFLQAAETKEITTQHSIVTIGPNGNLSQWWIFVLEEPCIGIRINAKSTMWVENYWDIGELSLCRGGE